MEFTEFFADPEQPDDDPTRWIHRPPDVPLQAATHEGVSYPLPLSCGSFVPGGPSTNIDLQYVPQPTSLVPFHPDQLLAEPAGHIQATEANLPEDLQRQLAEVEWQHEVARYQILEKAHAIPAISYVQEATTSYPYAAMGEPAAGYDGVYDTSNVLSRLPQIPNHNITLDDNSSAHGVDAGLWPAQQLLQTAVYPSSTRDHAEGYGQQYNPILNARDLDYNALGHSAYGQQPSLDPMALTASYCNMTPSVLSPYDQGGHHPSFITTTQLHPSQESLPLRAFGVVPITASKLPMNAANDLVHNTTDSSARPMWDRDIDASADLSSAAVLHELPSFSTINHSTTNNIGTTDTIGPKIPTGAIRGKAKRGKWRQSISASPYDTATGLSRAVDNIQFHTSPEADRHRQRIQPRTYSKRSKKNEWSCFGCRLSKKDCEDPAHGVCLRCQNILKMYSDCTRLPKFTCTVREKFFQLSVYKDIPPEGLSKSEMAVCVESNLPRSLKFEWDDKLPPMTVDGITIKFIVDFTARLTLHVRDLLDMIEPLHVRQFSTDDLSLAIYWSYSFSIVKWKNAICYFRPYLKDALDFHDSLHRHGHHLVLRHLEGLFNTKQYDDMITYLNVYYEGISNMEDGPMVDIHTKRKLLDLLKHHIFHIYREMFPKARGSKKARRSDDIYMMAKVLSLYSRTSSLLPEKFRSCRLGFIGRTFLQYQRREFTSEQHTTTVRNHEPSLEVHQRVERSPLPYPYIPAKLAVFLRMDTEIVELVDSRSREHLLTRSTLHQSLAIEYSPWSLSLVLRALFVHFDVENGTGKAIDPMIGLLSGFSFMVWELLIDLAGQYNIPQTPENIADWLMTNLDVLEVFVIDYFTDIFDEYLARHGPTFKKRSKRVV